jgi:hypothetical protein
MRDSQEVQALLERAHIRLSFNAAEEVHQIISQCRQVFEELERIITGLRRTRGDGRPSSVGLWSKLKWLFAKKSRVAVLRSNLEAYKSSLIILLIMMSLAERTHRRRYRLKRAWLHTIKLWPRMSLKQQRTWLSKIRLWPRG